MSESELRAEITEEQAIENIRRLLEYRNRRRAGVFLEVPAEEVRLWRIEKQLSEALIDFKKRFGRRFRPWMLQVVDKKVVA